MAPERGQDSDDALREFCARLKRLQTMSGMSQAALTGHARLGRTQMSNVLNGNIRKIPDWDVVQAVVRACLAHAKNHDIQLPPDLDDEQAWRVRHADLEHGEREDRSRLHDGHAVRRRRDRAHDTQASPASNGDGIEAAAQVEEFRADLLSLLAKLDEAACRGNLPAYLPAGAQIPQMARTVRLLGQVRQADPPESDARQAGSDADQGRRRAYRLPAEGDTREDRVPKRWEDVAAAHERLVVLADPGMGKSWLLRMHVHQLAQAARSTLDRSTAVPDDLVVPVPIRADVLAASPGRTLAEAVTGYLVREGLPVRSRQLMQQRIAAGRVVLLIDALDEVPRGDPGSDSQVPRKRLDDLLHDWVIQCSGTARCVLASRLTGYSGPPVPGAQQTELLPFSADDARAAVAAWDLPAQAQERVSRWLGDVAVSGMARLPLLLALICSLAARVPDHGSLPQTRAGLYEAVLWEFLSATHRRSDRGSPAAATSPEERQELLRVLAHVAYTFASTDRGWVDMMPYNELIGAVAAADERLAALGGSPAAALGRLTRQAGVLVPTGNPAVRDQPYMFMHRTVAEYLVARHLRDLPPDQRMRIVLEHQWFDPDWAEVFPILGGLMARQLSGAQAIVSCFLGQRPDPLERAFHTALRIIGESRDSNRLLPSGQVGKLRERTLRLLAGEVSRRRLLRTLASVPAWPEPVTDALVSSLRIHRDSGVKTDVLRALAGQDGAKVTGALLAQLNSGVVDVRRAAAWALDGRQDLQVAAGLLEHLGDENRSVRVAVARALAGQTDRATSEALLAALGSRNENARETAVMALKGRDDPLVTDGLINWIRDDDRDVRLAAARALVDQHGDAATGALLTALTDEDGWVRDQVVRALEGRHGEAVTAALLTALTDEDKRVRSQVVHALEGRHGEAVTAALLKALADDDPWVRSQAVHSLAGQQGESRAGTLADHDPPFRDTAPAEFAARGDREITGALIARLTDADNSVRHAAVEALADWPGSEVTESLLAHVATEDHWVRDAALKALINRGGREVTTGLVTHLRNSDNWVRAAVVKALGECLDDLATGALLARLDDEDSWVSLEATHALAGRPGQAVTERLLVQLSDDDGLVRGAAVRASAGRDDPQVTSALVARLEDADSHVRRAAVEVLAGRNDPLVTRALLARSHDRNRDVREAAVKALGASDDPCVTRALLARLTDRRSSVRYAALRALAGRQDPEVIAGLLRRLKDRDHHVRSIAVSMLARQTDPSILVRASRKRLWGTRPLLREASFDLADRIADAVYLKLPPRKRSQARRRLGRLTRAIHGRRSEFARQQRKQDEALARQRFLSPFL